MRVAIVSDQHFDVANRFEETVRVHQWIAEDIAQRGVDLILLGGDLFERKSVPADRNAAGEWLLSLSHTAPVVGVYGNHEEPNDLEVFNHLDGPHFVRFYDRPAVHVARGIAIGLLPWPKKAQLHAWLGGSSSVEDSGRIAGEMLRDVIRGLGAELAAHDGPRVLLAHAMIDGAKTDHDQPVIGADMALSLAEIALAGAHFVALGHVHALQEFEVDGAPVVYPGAATHRNFGEPGPGKGYVIAEFDEAGLVGWDRVEAPCTPMVLLDFEWDPVAQNFAGRDARRLERMEGMTGADVRFRYRVDWDHQEAALTEACKWIDKLCQVVADAKVDPVVKPKSAARAPGVAKAETLPAKLDAFWDARGELPNPADRERLKARVAEIEDAVGAGSAPSVRGGMRLEGIRLKGLLAFPEEVSIDFTKLAPEQKLVAITGPNGAGKSTLLNAWPCSVWRQGPNVGSLAEIARSRDAVIEATVVNGARYTITQMIDAVSRSGETLIRDEAGAPVIDSAKVSAADKWIAAHLPGADVFFASQFAAQREQGVSGQKPGDRKRVLLRALGIERLEGLAKAAGDRLRDAKARVATAEARLADERDRSRDPDAAKTHLIVGMSLASSAEDDLSKARLALADAEAAAADASALLREHERKRLEATDLRRRAVDLDAKAAVEGGKIVDLEKRVANNEAVLARAEEIRAAVARDAAIGAELAALDGQAAGIRARQQAPRDRLAQAARDVAKARADLVAAQEAVRRLEKVLADRGGVIAAVANLPGAQRRVAELETQVAEVEAELEAARGKTLATAEGRIEGLRHGLTMIAEDIGEHDDAFAALAEAERTLNADDEAVKAAAEVPAEIRRLTEKRAALTRELATTRGIVTEYERAASRAGEMERAASDLEAGRLEVGSAERAVPAADQVRAEAQAELDGLEREAAAHVQRKPDLERERAALAPTLKLADPLAQAEARLEELRPQLEAARVAGEGFAAEADQLRQQAAAVDPGEAPKAPDLDAARERVTAAETAAREAHAAVAVAERQLEEARASAAKIEALAIERDATAAEAADWNRLAADLGRDGLQGVEIGNAGPELSDLCSDLLHSCYGSRFTMAVETTRSSADGKRELEGLEIRVLDTLRGTEKPIEAHSGGEVTILDEAYSWALAALACRRAGIQGVTMVRDEAGAALDAVNGSAWIAMMRRAGDLVGADRTFFVTHDPALAALADVRLHVEAGRVVVR